MRILASLQGISDLIRAVAWPAVALAAVVWLRAPMGALLQRVASSARKLTIGSFSVELSESGPSSAPELAAIPESRAAYELGASYTPNLVAELGKPEPMPFALIDLGTGNRWLSSRLYLFCVLLGRTRDMKSLIFIETTDGVTGRFVGVAAVDDVVAGLDRAQPWLQVHLARAYEAALRNFAPAAPAGGQPATAPSAYTGSPPDPASVAAQVAETFVQGNQWSPVPVMPPAAPQPVPADWTRLSPKEGGDVLEHATWLTGTKLRDIVGSALDTFAYVVDDAQLDAKQMTTQVLRQTNREYVVLVDGQHRFKRTLIERRPLLEQLAAQATDAPLAQ